MLSASFAVRRLARSTAIKRVGTLTSVNQFSVLTARSVPFQLGQPSASRVWAPVTQSSIIPLTRAYSVISSDVPAKIYEHGAIKTLVEKPSAKVTLIDVREPSEFAAGHIPTAINLPFKSAPGALGLDAESFEDAFNVAKPDTDAELIFYCEAGVRSSAAEKLAGLAGYENRGNYSGSFKDWVANGSPVETPKAVDEAEVPPKAEADAPTKVETESADFKKD
ncbi:Rhodanese-like protein [Nadsonia fulvescens var. elongata DSM 6958]|uniref:Rhodanese-like protein n=1 Tax=Nadsonia fulvescens var. elongata DSM 6958 TaxID=857566 RepID=A0A1E3PK41_9ASCO|nr:Rhodanese-like protein [Nadsonia fulvescens var. elongata DSM 6958]